MKKTAPQGSKINLFEVPFTFRTEYEGGVMEEACRRMLSGLLFEASRKKKEENNERRFAHMTVLPAVRACSERKAEDMKLRQKRLQQYKKGYSGSQRQRAA